MHQSGSPVGHGLSRRAMVSVPAAALAVTALSVPAVRAERRKVVIAYSSPTLSPVVGYMSSIPIGLGLFRDEGLDVEVQPVNGAAVAADMVAAGRAQFTTHGTAGLFTAVDQGIPIAAFICQIPDNIYALAVLESSSILGVPDLAGKTVGIPSAGGATVLQLNAAARYAGLDPATGFDVLPVGGGLPALDALVRGRVAALFLWDEPYGLFEAKGARLRLIHPHPLGGLGLNTATSVALPVLRQQPDLVAGIARALARSLVFMAAAEPEELAKLHFQVYPESRPVTESEAETLRVERVRIELRRQSMRLGERVFRRSEKLGDESDAKIAVMRDLLLQGSEIRTALAPASYFTHQFVGEMNDWDFAPAIARAKAFRA